MRIDVITLFPEILRGGLESSILGRAQRRSLVDIHLHQLRDYATDKHRTVDERPYGGGPGMVLQCDPLFRAVETIQSMASPPGKVLLFSPAGQLFHQKKAQEYSHTSRLILVCGHYEGIDERVAEHLADEEVSIGDYVLTNGALAALVLIDATVRLLPDVVGNQASLSDESFSPTQEECLEGPQYTRPEVFRGWQVPEVLLSGHHSEIAHWRQQQARKKTLANRPELIQLNKDKDHATD